MTSISQTAFLHGVPTSGALWAPIAGHVDGWTPDLPGYGTEAPLPGRRLTVSAHLARLDSARATRGLPDWPAMHLVGHDYGGVLAAAAAARWGARSLVLCSTSLGLGWLPSVFGALPPLDRLVYRRYGGRRWLRQAVQPERRDEWLSTFGGVTARPELAEQMRQTALGISLSELAGVRRRLAGRGVPVLCLWGAEDRYFTPRQGRDLARRLGGRFVAVPDARHAAVWEQPEACAAALRSFWDSL